jgi:hypothetical protein
MLEREGEHDGGILRLLEITWQMILLDLMLYEILHNPFSDFLVSNIITKKKWAPGGIMRW